MAFDGERRFVGLGFGAIQAGLFAYEAQQSGGYAQPLVVDVRSELIDGLRVDGGSVRVNIARSEGIDRVAVGPLLAANSSVPEERETTIGAIAAADELATALPSVASYRSNGPSSPHRLLAAGLRRRAQDAPLIIFCAENHRNAAAVLRAAVLEALDPGEASLVEERARFVDTVIGKMSGVISDRDEIGRLELATVTSSSGEAILVEAFNRIIVSRVDARGRLHPGMPALREVDDLAPFEDAKLLGHNATHALGAFLGTTMGLSRYAELAVVPGAMRFLRGAFIEESGRVLITRYGGVDALFTPDGWAEFADDLLARMTNPHLADTIERAARDPRRKLGWDDRLVGLIRLGLSHGVPTPSYAMGVAAGLDVLRREVAGGSDAEVLAGIWPDHLDGDEVHAVLSAVAEGRARLQRWGQGGFDGLAGV